MWYIDGNAAVKIDCLNLFRGCTASESSGCISVIYPYVWNEQHALADREALLCMQAVEIVADRVKAHNVRALVVDPVLVSTSGHSLAGSDVGAALIKHLFPLATVITPNLPEASGLLGGKKVCLDHPLPPPPPPPPPRGGYRIPEVFSKKTGETLATLNGQGNWTQKDMGQVILSQLFRVVLPRSSLAKQHPTHRKKSHAAICWL